MHDTDLIGYPVTMTHPPSTSHRSSPPWARPAAAGAAAVAAVAAVWLVARFAEGDVGLMVRDPSTVMEVSWLTGAAAMVNATLWGAAAALGGFVASLHRTLRPGLVLFTGLSLALMAEDTLQVKSLGERVGVPEVLFLAGYAVAGLATAWLLRPARAGAGGWTLLAAGALLAVSIVVDQLRGDRFPGLILLEFTPMFVGAAVWTCVPVLVHRHLARPGPREAAVR